MTPESVAEFPFVAIVAVTRLRVRSPRFLPAFFRAVVISVRQARRSPGFLGGQLAREPGNAFWTLTAWEDLRAMRAYRDSGGHARIMPPLRTWCDEAAVVDWEVSEPQLPEIAEARRRIVDNGRVSPVDHPSKAQAERRIETGAKGPRAAFRFKPSRP